jgi:hypothetical protein
MSRDVATSGVTPRILFISRSLATPNFHGGCVYADAVLRFLHSQGGEILYVWLTDLLSRERPFLRKPQLGGHVSKLFLPRAVSRGEWIWSRNPLTWLGLPGYLLGKIRAKLGFKTASLAKSKSPEANARASHEEIALVSRLVRREAPDVILIDGTEIADLLRGFQGKTSPLKLILTHNVVHQRVISYQQHRIPLDFMALTRDEETRLLEQGDVIIAIQHSEANEFRSMVPEKGVVVTPMPAIPQPLPTTNQIPGRCLFVGGATQHNIDGLRWLLDEVWPLVVKEVPQASLSVCGGVGESFKDAILNVNFHGGVPDLTSYYEQASIALVPLRTGTGLKIKLVEAMRFGRAVVSTSIGVEGFRDLESGAVFPVTDAASAFATRMVDLLQKSALREKSVEAQDRWIVRNLGAGQAFGPLWEAIQGAPAATQSLATV